MRNFSLPRWSTVVDRTLDLLQGTQMRELQSHRKTPAEDAPLPTSNRFKMYGGGITKYSLLFPFGRKSSTTYHVLQRLWAPADGDDVNQGRTDAPAYDPQFFAPIPISIAPELIDNINLFRDDGYQATLLKQCAINFADAARINDVLSTELDRCGDLLKTEHADKKAARLPLLLSLRRACDDAADANNGRPVSEADVVQALRYLRKQNLYASVISPDMAAAQRIADKGNHRARDLAWRIAYKMAVTERGMEMLYRLTATPQSSAGTIPTAAQQDQLRRQHLNLKHFFKAADSLLDEHAMTHVGSNVRPLSANPAALLEHCYQQCELPVAPANTLLIHGLTGIQTAMCKEQIGQPHSQWERRIDRTARRISNNAVNQRQIATIRKYGDLFDKKFVDRMAVEVDEEHQRLTALLQRQQRAMGDRFAFKWVSDGHVSNASGSFLHALDQRCKKIGVYQQRRADRIHRSGANALFKRSAEIIKAKNKTYVPPLQTESPQHNPDSMLLHREVMQSALRALEEMLMRDVSVAENNQAGDASHYVLEAGPHRPILKNIARLALVRHWLKQPLHYLSNDLEPTQLDIDKLASPANLQALFGDKFGDDPALSAGAPQRNALIAAFKEALPCPALSPELLAQWAQQCVAGQSAPNHTQRNATDQQPHAKKTGEELHESFAASIEHLQHGWKSSLVPTGDPLQHFNRAIAEQIEQMRLGNLRTFSGGTSHGISIPAVSVPVSLAKTLGLVKLLAGGTYSHRGMVNLEVGISSWGGFIRVTTSHEDQLGANIGVTAGPKAQWGTAVGGAAVYADVEGAASGYRAHGYCFCLPRGGAAMTGRTGSKAGVNGDAEVAAGLARIFRILTNTADAPTAKADQTQSTSALRRIGEEVPDVSVSMVGSGDSRSNEMYLGVRAGVILGVTDESKQYGIGFNASASAIYSRKHMRYRQRNSALQVDVANRTVRKSLNLQGNLPLAVGLGRRGGNAAAFNNGAQSIAGPLFGMGGANAEVYKSGFGTQTNRIIYEGKISKNTYANIFHPNAKTFCDAVERNMAKWANYMAAHDPDCPVFPLSLHTAHDVARAREVAAIRQALVDKHTLAIRKYLARVKREVHPSDVFFDFLELTPEATALLNHYYESEIECRAAGYDVEADQYKAALEAVWKHDAAWAPYFIVNSISQQSNTGASFNLVLSASSEQPSTSITFTNYCG